MPQLPVRTIARLVAIVVFHVVGTMPALVAEEPDEIVFHDDYNTALREAKLTGKPLFLEFRCSP